PTGPGGWPVAGPGVTPGPATTGAPVTPAGWPSGPVATGAPAVRPESGAAVAGATPAGTPAGSPAAAPTGAVTGGDGTAPGPAGVDQPTPAGHRAVGRSGRPARSADQGAAVEALSDADGAPATPPWSGPAGA